MKHIYPRCLITALTAFCGLLPLSSQADHKVTVYRDRDGDGHYNKKTYDVGRHYNGGRWYGGYGHGGYGYYGRPYFSPGYYSRPYYYGYGPSIAFSYYSAPRYDTGSYVYRDYPSYDYSNDLAVDVQRALKRRGYYGGPVDGAVGPGTRSAIRAYQAARGLPVTGRIDNSLVRALGIG